MTAVMVTGGCGFIGSALVLALRRERPDWTVVTYDRLSYAGNVENLAALENDARHVFVRGDVADSLALDEAVARHGVGAIFHLAAESHVDRSLLDASEFVRSNVLGTQVVLEVARRRGVRRVVLASTDEVYGSMPEGTRADESSPLRPSSPYAASKTAADLLALAAHRSFGQDVVITRGSNTYGPRQFPEKLIALMIARALEDEALPVYGDGLHARDWLHVEDHANALLLALEKGTPGAIYNIGADDERTTLDVVRAILAALGKDERLIRFVEDRPGHDRRYALDFTAAKRALGYAPAYRFQEGLLETVRWYVEHRAFWERALRGDQRAYFERQYRHRLEKA
jgi:dTDP-glucose 4,6-dehydratase